MTADGTREKRPPPVLLTRLVTIDVSVRVVFAAVMVGSLWLLFAGHNQPGGGFVGGIVAGAAISLRYVAGGIGEVRRLSRGKPWMVLGSGVLIAVVVAIVPLLLGGEVLETGSFTVDLPLLGTMKVTSAMVFDIGVYFAVIGLALMVFESFGDDAGPKPARPVAERAPEPVPPSQSQSQSQSQSHRRPRRCLRRRRRRRRRWCTDERAHGVHRGRAVRRRHVPAAAAQAVAADHRARPHRPRRQRRVRHGGPPRHAAADRVTATRPTSPIRSRSRSSSPPS